MWSVRYRSRAMAPILAGGKACAARGLTGLHVPARAEGSDPSRVARAGLDLVPRRGGTYGPYLVYMYYGSSIYMGIVNCATLDYGI